MIFKHTIAFLILKWIIDIKVIKVCIGVKHFSGTVFNGKDNLKTFTFSETEYYFMIMKFNFQLLVS
jgi:hypothetical protein